MKNEKAADCYDVLVLCLLGPGADLCTTRFRLFCF